MPKLASSGGCGQRWPVPFALKGYGTNTWQVRREAARTRGPFRLFAPGSLELSVRLPVNVRAINVRACQSTWQATMRDPGLGGGAKWRWPSPVPRRIGTQPLTPRSAACTPRNAHLKHLTHLTHRTHHTHRTLRFKSLPSGLQPASPKKE